MSGPWHLLEIWFASVSAGLLLSAELGFQVGWRVRQRAEEPVRTHYSGLEAALLGLLALLLGFTFSMAVTRFDLRKELIVDEANALGTAYLRGGFLAPEDVAPFRATLRKYVDSRVAFYSAKADWNRAVEAERETQEVGNQLWAQVEAANRKGPVTVTLGLLAQAVNESLDLDTKGLWALENHVPDLVLVQLLSVAVVACVAVGLVAGLSGRRALTSQLALPLLLAMVMAVIVDLDRPRRGLIQVGQRSMQRLQQQLQQRGQEEESGKGPSGQGR